MKLQATGFKKACGLRLAAYNWQQGFTLVEILIAVAIASLILTIIYRSYATSIDTMNYTREKMDAFSIIRLTLSRMNEEITSSFFAEDSKVAVFSGGEGKIDFVSSSHERIFKDSREYDLSEIGYFTEPEEEGERLSLWRREDRTPDDDVLEGGEREKIIDGLEGLEFKYYDGKEWLSEWDSKEERGLPQAVGITLRFPEKEFFTVAFIPLGR